MERRLLLLALLVAALAWPASAFAASGSLVNGVMSYDADPGEGNAIVFTANLNDFGEPTFEVRDAPTVAIAAASPCFNGGAPNVMECPQDGNGSGAITILDASLGDGNDTISVQANLPTSIGAGGGRDTMTGGPAADFLRGGQGGDTIGGGGGDDQIVGDDQDPALGGGDDTIDGNAGSDSIDGENGDDTVRGGTGNDQLSGGEGNDTFPAESDSDGADVLFGGPGIDTATFSARSAPQTLSLDDLANDGQGGGGDNIHSDVENLVGGSGPDVISGSDAANGLDGGPGDDSIAGGNGDDTLTGAAGNDNEDGGAGNDGQSGGEGDDTLAGGDGADVLGGDSGADTLRGDAGADSLSGGDGADTLSGGSEDDTLGGDTGNDSLSGDSGADALNGGDGNDNLGGGEGDDSLAGGNDGDALAGGDGADALDGGPGDDALDGGTGPDAMAGGDGTDLGDYASRTAGVAVTLDGRPGDGEPGEGDNVEPDVENLRGGAGADTFVGSAAANTLDGGAGEDYEDGAAGADTLVGGDSGDVLRTRGSAEGDAVTCGPGPDFVVAKPADDLSPDCDRVDRGVNQKPKLRDSALVAPAGGSLQMSPTGIVRRVPLQDRVVLPLRSIVDTVSGAVRVTSSLTARRAQTVKLDHGAFDITQTAAKLAVTQFALQGGDFAGCPAKAHARTTAHTAAAKVVRKLWANGKGRFRTRGRYAAASVRGTKWLTEDRCDGTLIRVAAGAVTVKDLVAKKTVVVKAGRSYLAAATRPR